jgi:hypothetical protein
MADEDKDKTTIERVRERRQESLDWFNDNYYGEFLEVMLGSQCRTKPIMQKNRKGELVEDKTRTNVAMPDIYIMIQRNTARMTAQPPSNRYLVPSDEYLDSILPEGVTPAILGDQLSAWNLMQFDLSGELAQQVMHVKQEETFGISVMKHFWMKKSVERIFRYKLEERLPRALILACTSKFSPEEIQAEVAMKGATVTPAELSELQTRYGSQIVKRMQIPRFEGPAGKWIFMGDIFPEPGFVCFDAAGYIVEDAYCDMRELDDILEMEYVDPDSDEVLPLVDLNDPEKKKMVEELKGDQQDAKAGTDAKKTTELRKQMWDVLGKSDPDAQRNAELIPGKRFRITEEHSKDDKGRRWIHYIANDKFDIGKMPYPCDLDGMSSYTEFVGLPSLLSGIGDSSPRILRHLYYLHNTVVNQRTDLVTNLLRRPVFRKNRADIPDMPLERGQFRIFDVKDPSDFSFPNEADAPQSAFETENHVRSVMAQAEPALNAIESGVAIPGGGGKGTATAASITQKNIEGLTQMKLNNLHISNGVIARKKFCMLQQMSTEAVNVPSRFAQTPALKAAIGAAPNFALDPYQIQRDVEVLPEENSTLAQDDEFHRMNAENLVRFANEMPDVINKKYAATQYIKTIRGVDPAQAIIPDPPPGTPPPPPDVKVSMSISMKFEELQPLTQQAVLQRAGLPFNMEDAVDRNTLKVAGEVGEAAEKAAKIHESVNSGSEGNGNGSNLPNG